MTSPLTESQREVVSRVTTLDGSNVHGAQSEAREELDGVLRALEVDGALRANGIGPWERAPRQWRHRLMVEA